MDRRVIIVAGLIVITGLVLILLHSKEPRDYVIGRIIVNFHDTVTESQIRLIVKEKGCEVISIQEMKSRPIYTVVVGSPNDNTEYEMLDEFRKLPEVESVALDRIYTPV